MLDHIVSQLMRGKRRDLLVLCALAIAGGLACAWWQESFMPLARSGAVLIVISIFHIWRSLPWTQMMEGPVMKEVVVDVATTMERRKFTGPDADRQAKAITEKKVSQQLPELITAVQQRFLADNLLIGAIGTLIWGFGDLTGYWYHAVVKLM